MPSTATQLQRALDPAILEHLTTYTVVLLIALLVVKELVSTLEGPWERLGRYLNVVILPLLTVFGVSVALRVVDALAK